MTKHTGFREIVSFLVAINFVGCTTLRPIEAEPEEIHDRIRHGHIVTVGDRVRIFTEDGKEYQFKVTSVDANHMSGENVTIPVDHIVALETRETSIGKTALLASGTVGIALILFLVIVAPVVFLAPG